MTEAVIGLLHPGEMGSALGKALQLPERAVIWASAGRSAATTRRAEQAGLLDVGTVDEVARRSDVIVSVCPPGAAVDLARSVAGFRGVFVDANAVSPATARSIASLIETNGGRYVDGGIVGPPPRAAGMTRLYLSGAAARLVADLFANTVVDARIVSDRPDAASAVKMAYAAWTKGTAALLLAIRALAHVQGMEDALLDEWRASLPELVEQSLRSARSTATKGWRWVSEMEEIAATFAAADLPAGFHRAAAEVFARSPRLEEAPDEERMLREIVTALTAAGDGVGGKINPG